MSDSDAREQVLPETKSEWARLAFRGWWDEDEKQEVPEPWETFCVYLYGVQGGDLLETRAEISKALRASGYELRLVRVST